MADDKKHLINYQNIVDNPSTVWKSENILRFYLPQFFFLLLIVVSATRFIHHILRPFNQPHFVAEFLAGLLVCPQLIEGTMFYSLVTPAKALLGIETMAHVGLIYNVFLTGLEMNLDTVIQARKKATTIAIAGTLIPMALGATIYSLAQALYKTPKIDAPHYDSPSAYLFWALVLSVTNYPVLAHILSDLKILYTGLGRVAVTAAIINDFYNWAMFVLLIPFATHSEKPFVSVVLTMAFVLFCYFVLRPFLVRLIDKRTEKNEWDNYRLAYVLVGVFACAHVTEMLGTHSIVGALVYGLILPRGKFADMLMERSDDLVSVYLAPLFFVGCGVRFDCRSFVPHKLLKVAIIVLLSCATKIVSTIIATGFYRMPFRDGVALGALMNTKGILPLVMLNIASDRKILSRDFYSIMVFASVLMTILVSPTINYIYKPKKQFEKDKLRTIQNLRADAEIRVLACVHNSRQATGMISILEASSAPNATPLIAFALQLIELKGRGTAFLVNQNSSLQSQADTDSITAIFAELAHAHASVETLAAVSSYETIHRDIYNIADEKQASLILLPFHKQSSAEGALEETNAAFKEINQNVMHRAPCSVGILVDRGHGSLSKTNLHVTVLFIGGPDDREALAIAWRMAKHPGIHLSMVHILLFGKVAEVDRTVANDEAHGLLSTVLDSRQEKELDEEYVSMFRLMAVNNEDSITYAAKEVHTGDDVPLVLNELDRGGYDLYVLGHGKGRNSMVLSNLLEWTDCPELGVIGDMLASNSFGSRSSVLVVQQYGFGGTNFRTCNQGNSNNADVESLFGKAE
ncbi:Cation/H(+) antiporter 15 [Spatholobus suberectus]|nr:Cation/H(+) antiporter 15 [Spatholobus suberectus]